MTFFVLYKASRNAKDRAIIPRELRSLGCTRIHKSLWEVKEEKLHTVLRILQKNEPMILRKAREIRKPDWDDESKVSDLGSLLVVAYNIPKEKRKTINRALWQMPCIPLCRAVYAFPQKHHFSDKENEQVATFLKLIKENNGDAKVISRIVIEDRPSVGKLLDEIANRVQKETSEIILSAKVLVYKAEKYYTRAHLSKNLKELERRLESLKRVTSSYEKWLKVDFSKNLLKTYRVIKKTENLIEQK